MARGPCSWPPVLGSTVLLALTGTSVGLFVGQQTLVQPSLSPRAGLIWTLARQLATGPQEKGCLLDKADVNGREVFTLPLGKCS